MSSQEVVHDLLEEVAGIVNQVDADVRSLRHVADVEHEGCERSGSGERELALTQEVGHDLHTLELRLSALQAELGDLAHPT